MWYVANGHALRAEPPQSSKQIRNVVILPAAEQYFGRVVNDFLKPTEVTLFAVLVNRNTVTDLQEDQGVDQRGAGAPSDAIDQSKLRNSVGLR